jgi:hypothetical protein
MSGNDEKNASECDSPKLESTPDHHLAGTLRRDFEQLRTEMDELSGVLEERNEAWINDISGGRVADLRKDKALAIQSLSDSNPSIRIVAIQVTREYWGIGKVLESKYKEMSLAESETDVRAEALLALASCYSATKNKDIGGLFAKIAQDEALPDDLRRCAFTSLVDLHGFRDFQVQFSAASLLELPVNHALVIFYL